MKICNATKGGGGGRSWGVRKFNIISCRGEKEKKKIYLSFVTQPVPDSLHKAFAQAALQIILGGFEIDV